MIMYALPAVVVLLVALVVRIALVRRAARTRQTRAAGLVDPFQQVLTDVSLLFALIDPAGQIVFANERLAQVSGWSRRELVGRRWDATFGSGLVDLQRRLGTLTSGTAAAEVENLLATRSGDHRVVSWSDTLTLDAAGRVTGLGRIGTDVTTRRNAEDRVAYLARYDELTGLPNRALFCDWVDLAVRESARYSRNAAALLIDIDNFKLVNESFGHAAADEILKAFSHRLRDAALGAELVARHTGDEFLILLADTDTPDGSTGTHDHPADVAQMAEAVAGRLRHLLRIPFQCMDEEVYLTVSVGSALYPRDAATTDDVLAQARLAIGRQRIRAGANRALDVGRLPPRQEISMVARLHRAIETQQFLLRYQPVVELNTGRIRSAEALIRWQPPGGDLIPPAEFIPLAERSGLIGPITSWVVDQVCRQHVAWRQRGIDIELAFNLPVTLWEPAAIRNLLQLIRSHGIAPPELLVEVTESTAMRQTADNEAVLRMIGSAGLRLALDDFGTGHSSLARLKQMPATTLKIDRSFVRDLPDDGDSAALVVAIVQLSRNLGMEPLAEGIETEEQWRFLRDVGCTLGQGYLLSHPVSADAVEALWSLARLDQAA
jgi:diguanylate cyclase (GGDEF)-like protein/PAS domain S-box-containing protein